MFTSKEFQEGTFQALNWFGMRSVPHLATQSLACRLLFCRSFLSGHVCGHPQTPFGYGWRGSASQHSYLPASLSPVSSWKYIPQAAQDWTSKIASSQTRYSQTCDILGYWDDPPRVILGEVLPWHLDKAAARWHQSYFGRRIHIPMLAWVEWAMLHPCFLRSKLQASNMSGFVGYTTFWSNPQFFLSLPAFAWWNIHILLGQLSYFAPID